MSTPLAAAGPDPQPPPRLDAYLRAAAAAPSPTVQRVIIRARAGTRDAVRLAVMAAGDQAISGLGADTLVALVRSDRLATLAAREDVVSMSSDAKVAARGGQRLGGLLGGVGGLLGSVTSGVFGTVTGLVTGLTGVVTGILDPATSTEGPAVSPRSLRETLGVSGAQTGDGIGVALIDSGLETSSEFYGRVKAFYDFTDGRAQLTSASDPFGHGTHVAGIIGGSGARSHNYDYRGLAPKVTFAVFKVLDGTGAGYTSDVIRAIDFAVEHRDALNVDIINLSLGHPIYEPAATDPLVQAVERASRAGVIVVAAAGNLGKNPATGLPGYAGITSPGNAPSAVTVGAVQTFDTARRSDDRIPDYSSSGPTWYDAMFKPDFLAPGHNIVAIGAKNSLLYKNYPQLRAADADYMRLSGTSMATGVATGVIALMLEAHMDARYGSQPPLTPNTVKAVLQYTAVDVKDELGLEFWGSTSGMTEENTAWQNVDFGPIHGMTFGAAVVLPRR